MINLMYLVLTAMLALNVSAKIINAFFLVDKGIQKSNLIVDGANEGVIKAITKTVEAYPKNREWLDKAKKANEISKEFSEYVATLRSTIIDAAGDNNGTEDKGDYDEKTHKPKGKKNKDVTTRILVKEGKGAEFEKKITETREKLLALVLPADRKEMEEALPLALDQSFKEEEPDLDWATYNFNQMPVAAVLPMFSKFQNDVKTSASALLSYFTDKAQGVEIKFDTFEPVVSARKGYVIEGEKYEAEVFLSASSSQPSVAPRITVNGSSLPVKEGKGTYSVTANGTGTKKYNVSISVTNPMTKETKTYQKEFEYEVGKRSVTVSADKMNVFYIGVDNPVSIVAAGISSNKLNVSMTGGNMSGSGTNRIVKVSSPGEATITVSGDGLAATNFKFRVKRIPDPIARLGNNDSGSMASGEFKAQGGVGAWLDNFDFEAKCSIEGFVMTRVAKRQDPVDATNSGARFSGQAATLIGMAAPGDIFYFENIRARCPGDAAARKINSLVFKIR